MKSNNKPIYNTRLDLNSSNSTLSEYWRLQRDGRRLFLRSKKVTTER